jgi:hypothetical protein
MNPVDKHQRDEWERRYFKERREMDQRLHKEACKAINDIDFHHRAYPGLAAAGIGLVALAVAPEIGAPALAKGALIAAGVGVVAGGCIKEARDIKRDWEEKEKAQKKQSITAEQIPIVRSDSDCRSSKKDDSNTCQIQ